MELYWEIQVEPDFDEQERMFREILEISKDQFYTIGIALPTDGYAVANNNLHNVKDSYPNSWIYLTPGHIDPCIWYLDR